jgi:hypothetical protein
VVIKALDELSFTCENIHEVIGQLTESELLKKYSHPIVFIFYGVEELLYDKSEGFAGAEIEFKVFKHPYF